MSTSTTGDDKNQVVWDHLSDDAAEDIVRRAARLTRALLARHHVEESHGFAHAMAVLRHIDIAHQHFKIRWPATQQNPNTIVLRTKTRLAALLHDVDDPKYFPDNSNCDNARRILAEVGLDAETIEEIVESIGWVSFSKNKNKTPGNFSTWQLLPRFADRLESMGWTGVHRTLAYSREKKRPLDDELTPRCETEEALWAVASPARCAAYKGASRTAVDHFYDKMLHVTAKCDLPYFDDE